jgi:hypothetical protein
VLANPVFIAKSVWDTLFYNQNLDSAQFYLFWQLLRRSLRFLFVLKSLEKSAAPPRWFRIIRHQVCSTQIDLRVEKGFFF